MLRNIRRNVVTTSNPQITAANFSEYQRALFFVRLGAIDICNEAPYHIDFDKWPYNDQLNYEAGRVDTSNLIAAVPHAARRQLAREIVQAWPENMQGVPPTIARALGMANQTTGSAYPKTVQPNSDDVQAAVTRDARGRMLLRVPTVSEE